MGCNKQQEILVILLPDAISYPRAVVIVFGNAHITDATVLRSTGFREFAGPTHPIFLEHGAIWLVPFVVLFSILDGDDAGLGVAGLVETSVAK